MELLQNKECYQMNLVAAMQNTLKPGVEQGYHNKKHHEIGKYLHYLDQPLEV